ncbi:MAG: hypothetical protein SFW09_03505 [Hyphomicrobiaceae bacterium]|nr:hypothetical protein [Hyphomicrobiaceae bacterium]
MRTLVTLTIGLVVAGWFAGEGAAHASDYSHVCRTIDDQYEIDDGVLVRKTDRDRNAIPYETLRETVLSRREGYCIARGQQFKFESRSYALRIRFRDNGRPVELEALCELAADGLPAAYTCEREVVTREETGGVTDRPVQPTSGPSHWSHNGSVMRLEANGADRRFVYEVPRRGLVEAGVKPGDTVFEGRREGQTYTGAAYIFTRSCGRVGYSVAGNVSADERTVVLEGQAPLMGEDCKPRAYRRDRLQFDLTKR